MWLVILKIIVTLTQCFGDASLELAAKSVQARLPSGLIKHSAVYDGDELVYILGGQGEQNYQTKILSFNLTSHEVKLVGEMPGIGNAGSAIIGDTFSIYYFGGGVDGKDVYKFDIKTNKSLNITTLSKPAKWSGAMSYNKTHLYVFRMYENDCFWLELFNTITLSQNKDLATNCTGKDASAIDDLFNLSSAVTGDYVDTSQFALEYRRFKTYKELAHTRIAFQELDVKRQPVYLYRNKNKGEVRYFKGGRIISRVFKFADGKTYMLCGTAAVYVHKANRIYMFGGLFYTSSLKISNEIWYIDLSPDTNKDWLWITLAALFVILIIILTSTLYGGRRLLQSCPRKVAVNVNGNETKPLKFSYSWSANNCAITITVSENEVWKSLQLFETTSPIPIAKGSFAIVYKAVDLGNREQFYAIKKISLYNALKQMDWELSKVLMEVNIAEKLRHENIVELFSWWVEDQSGKIIDDEARRNLCFNEWASGNDYFLFLQMEFCDFNLRDWLTVNDDLRKRLTYDLKLMFGEIIKGLRAIHTNKIIHRDIKPNNILFSAKEHMWKIGDFGLSVEENDTSSDLTIIGCTAYRSPEMMCCAGYDFKTDVFSLGLSLLEILIIFESVCVKISTFEKLRSSELQVKDILEPNDINCELRIIISKMLEVDPVRRIDISSPELDQVLF